LIDKNGKLSETRNVVKSHISGKEIKWTEGDRDMDWEGMKLVLTDQLEVKELHHNYKASGIGLGTTTIAKVKSDDDGRSQQNIFEKVIFKETQAEVYKLVEPFLMSALNGKNIGLFMYGGTQSGKTYTAFGEGDGDFKGIVSRMIEAIEGRKFQQEVADNIFHNQNNGNDNPHKENLGVSVRCFEIYGRAGARGETQEYNVYDLIHNKETFSDDRKPSASSTLYRYKKYAETTIKQYQTKNNNLTTLNEVWYEAEAINNNFTAVDPTKPGFNPKELSTTFINDEDKTVKDKTVKQVVTSSS
jgi:hypothetical protein